MRSRRHRSSRAGKCGAILSMGLGVVQLLMDFFVLPRVCAWDASELTILTIQMPSLALITALFLTRREPAGWFLLLLYIPACIYEWWLVMQPETDLDFAALTGFILVPLNLAALALLLTYGAFAALRRWVDRYDKLDLP